MDHRKDHFSKSRNCVLSVNEALLSLDGIGIWLGLEIYNNEQMKNSLHHTHLYSSDLRTLS